MFSVSMICLDMLNLYKQLEKLNKTGIKRLHIDLADGKFVKNFGLPIEIVKVVKENFDYLLDVHLMIEDPEKYMNLLKDYGADTIFVHLEAINDENIEFFHNFIKIYGRDSLGLVINSEQKEYLHLIEKLDIQNIIVMTVIPGFSKQKFIECSLNIFKELNDFKKKTNSNYSVQADGAVRYETIEKLLPCGCNSFVIGTSVLNNGNVDINYLKSLLKFVYDYNNGIIA